MPTDAKSKLATADIETFILNSGLPTKFLHFPLANAENQVQIASLPNSVSKWSRESAKHPLAQLSKPLTWTFCPTPTMKRTRSLPIGSMPMKRRSIRPATVVLRSNHRYNNPCNLNNNRTVLHQSLRRHHRQQLQRHLSHLAPN